MLLPHDCHITELHLLSQLHLPATKHNSQKCQMQQSSQKHLAETEYSPKIKNLLLMLNPKEKCGRPVVKIPYCYTYV